MKQCGPDWSGPLNCPPEQEFFGLSTVEAPAREGHLEGAARWAPIDGRSRGGRRRLGVARGAALVAEAADQLGLTQALSRALAGVRQRRSKHDPGRVVRDLAVMLADGGDCLADLRAVRDQQSLFGEVASDATAFRVIDAIAGDPALLDAVRAARARRASTPGTPAPSRHGSSSTSTPR